MRKGRSGIINRMPRTPPHIASRATCRKPLPSEGASPHIKSAGMVKMVPEASDDEADPAVCPILTSRIEALPMTGRRAAKAATMMTASGMEVLMVRPTRRPR